jgi:hypothetical protein
MDTEHIGAVSDSWLRVSDGQILAMPAATWFRNGMAAQAIAAAAKLPQPVPMLNWPPTLFDDVRRHH